MSTLRTFHIEITYILIRGLLLMWSSANEAKPVMQKKVNKKLHTWITGASERLFRAEILYGLVSITLTISS